MQAKITRRKFTSKEFHKMAEAGILHEDDRLELIEGDIIEMAPIGSRHAACVNRLVQLLTYLLGGSAIISVQNPVLIHEEFEPQPDISILKPRDDFYADKHPGPHDILLLIEVADSSMEYDQYEKAPRYARAGVPELWIVDLPGLRVLPHRNPSPESYRDVTVATPGQTLTAQLLPAVSLSISEILGI